MTNVETITAFLRQMDREVVCNPSGEEWAFANGESIFNCYASARRVADALGGAVVGYYREDNPTAELSDAADGHDFALIGDRFVVDYWAACVVAAIDRPILDLDDPVDRLTALRLYGQPAAWEPVVIRQPRRRT